MRRPATLADVEAIVAMGHRFLTQSVYRGTLADNPDRVRHLATQLITSPDGDVIVADDGGTLVGMLAVVAYAHHLSGERVAGEVAWWVDPAARGDLGVRMLRDAERWARARGAIRLEMIAPNPRIELLYERLGYAPVERTYSRRLGPC